MELNLENLKKLKKGKKHKTIEPELIKFGKWLGENNFCRNSMGIWSTNCMSFKRMTDEEIVNMFLENPNEYKNHLAEIRE
jgi:hypothetical protein